MRKTHAETGCVNAPLIRKGTYSITEVPISSTSQLLSSYCLAKGKYCKDYRGILIEHLNTVSVYPN